MDEITRRRRQNVRKIWNVKTRRVCTLLSIGMGLWGIGFGLFGVEHAGVNSPVFKLIIVFLTAKLTGVVCGLFRIPPMIGMLSIGVAVRNIGYINEETGNELNSVLRQLALVNILLVAGLGLDGGALKRMSWIVSGLAIFAPIIEILFAGLFAYWFFDLPVLWCLLFGLLLGAVSPALVIPCLLGLQSKGYGVEKGIHTLVIASSAIDDIACIAGFGIVIGMIFGQGSFLNQILQGPLSIIIGVVYGLLFGYLAHYLPHTDDKYLITLRTCYIAIVSLLANFGSRAIDYEGAGGLACIITAFVASIGWRRTGSNKENPVEKNYSILWEFFEPISFSLIGLEVDFQVLKLNVVLWSSFAMLLALIARILVSLAIMKFSNLNWKEMIFVAICCVPKATVQAALGPVALDYARNSKDNNVNDYAHILLITAVVSIILTAPIGALLIVYTGPKLLHKSNDTEEM